VLTVSEVNVVDEKGVVRARLAGDFHDEKRRGSKAAGLIVYDDTGQERGGYVTFAPGRQVALTLDSSKHQTALFVASAEGGAALKMWEGDHLVDVRVDETGPSIHAMRAKQVAFHAPQPVGFEKGEMCEELRGALKTMAREKVLGFCRERTSEEACQACLGGQ
jgi:hypothetical protein